MTEYMADDRYYEKDFQVVLNIKVTGSRPLSDVTPERVEVLVTAGIARSGLVHEPIPVAGCTADDSLAPTARFEKIDAVVEEIKPKTEPITLGEKTRAAMRLTDDARRLLEIWHAGEHEESMKHALRESLQRFAGKTKADYLLERIQQESERIQRELLDALGCPPVEPPEEPDKPPRAA